MKITFLVFYVLVVVSPLLAQAPSPTRTPSIVGEPSRFPDSILRIKPNPPYIRPDAETRRKRFIKSTVGPLALGKMVVKAGISTWTNSPEEWGTKWEGFGRRLASKFGKNAIKQTTIFGLDEAFKLDSKFYRSKNKSVSVRVKNALLSPVTARDRAGKRVFGLPRVAGTYASSILAYEVWYPDRYGWKNGVRSGTISLGFHAAFSLFKEFVWKK